MITAPPPPAPVPTMLPSPVRAAVLAVNVALASVLVVVIWPAGSSAVQAPPDLTPAFPPTWAPPSWFPEETAAELWVLESLNGDGVKEKGPPRVRSASAIIADLDSGEVLFTKNADDHRPVASLTKMISALALASTQPDLEQTLCVTKAEWPSWSGARSRFETGVCHGGREWLGAALVASDNRGAMGLASLSGLPYDLFLERMAEVSFQLGIEGDTWADPTGLEDDNLATARDMLKAVTAVSLHSDLAPAASAPTWTVDRKTGPHRLGSTNRLVHRFETLAAKTGYTDTARYCFATVVRTDDGRRLAVAVLGAPTSGARFDDTRSLIQWAETR